MENAPLASVVIANWNGERWLRVVLPALREQRFRDFEIVLVDNGSTDGSLAYVRANFPELILVPQATNLGFAGGSNAGIRAARGRYIVLLNNDTRPEPDWLGALVQAAEADTKVGMAASLVLDAERENVLDSAGVGVWWDGFSRQMLHGETVPPGLTAGECLMPSGCAGLYRREMLDEVGLLDEDFFAYCEDTDLGLRGRFAGWACMLAPGSRVHHYYSQSGGRDLSRKIFWVERNHYYVAIKNYPWPLLLALPFTSAARLVVQAWGMLRGRAAGRAERGTLTLPGALKAFARAYLSLLWNLPRMIGRRWALGRTRRVGVCAQIGLIARFRASIADVLFN